MQFPAMLAVLAVVALAGCGAPEPGPMAPPMEDGKYVIHVTAGSAFQPANATIPVGATVVWVSDGGFHDVTEGRPGSSSHAWSSDDDLGAKMVAGDRYERTFGTAGTVHYRCVVHESTGMVGTLVVA